MSATYILAYRIVAITVGCILLVLTALFAASIAAVPPPAPPLRQHGGCCTPRRATLGHAAVTTVACLITIVAASLNTLLGKRDLYILLATCVGVAQGIDGYFSWSRYAVIYPDWKPSCLVTAALHAFILIFHVSPFLSTWVSWSPYLESDVDSNDTPLVLAMGLIVWYFAAIPARILTDFVLGCSMVTRIHELRLAVSKFSGCVDDVVGW